MFVEAARCQAQVRHKMTLNNPSKQPGTAMVGPWPVLSEGETPTLDTYLIYSYLMSM